MRKVVDDFFLGPVQARNLLVGRFQFLGIALFIDRDKNSDPFTADLQRDYHEVFCRKTDVLFFWPQIPVHNAPGPLSER